MGTFVGGDVGESVKTVLEDGGAVGREVGATGASVGAFVAGTFVGGPVTGDWVGLLVGGLVLTMAGIGTVNTEPQLPDPEPSNSPF